MFARQDLASMLTARELEAPEAIAVRFRDRSVTYRQLGAWSDGLALMLLERGVAPCGTAVVCLERSLELIVTLVALQKLGIAYLPVPTDLPPARRDFIFRDARPSCVLTDRSSLERMGEACGLPVLAVDESDYETRDTSGEPLARHTHPLTPVYVLYTSGSTGEPKGVVNHQAGILNRLGWMRDHYRVGPEDRILQKTPYTFDVSVWEFFLPLISGATLVLAEPGGHEDVDYLAGLIEAERVTLLHFVPSMLNAFLEECGRRGFESVRHVICSGEALSPAVVEKFRRIFHRGANLANLYGPTEASIDVSYYDCSTYTDGPVPIGKAIRQTSLHILDSSLRPVPRGERGELYLGGTGLATGYLARAALTAEKFCPDPFSGTAGARLYATGDFAREAPDGNVLFLGRIDHQVKINGQRIELGEIEAQLARSPLVAAAVVVAHLLPDSRRQLVAYVVPRNRGVEDGDGEGLRIDDPELASSLRRALRDELSTRLPAHMLPHVVVPMNRIPLSRNGKVDRGSLPSPGASGNDRSTEAPPGDRLQRDLMAAWEAVLGRDARIGLHTDFFALGGDSILSMRIASRLKKAGYSLSSRDVLRYPSIARLAEVLASRTQSRGTSVAPSECESPIAERTSAGALEALSLSPRDIEHIHRRLKRSPHALVAACECPTLISAMLHESVLEGVPHCHLELVACDIADIEPDAFLRAWRALVRRHEILRTGFHLLPDGRALQLVFEDADLDFDVVDCSRATPDEFARVCKSIEAELMAGGIDLAASSLMRLRLLENRDGTYRLIWLLHHALTDGWTYHVLLRDVLDLYAAGCPDGRRTAACQYRDFCRLLELHDGPAAASYWHAYLAGMREGTSLVTALGAKPGSSPRRIRRVEMLLQRDEVRSIERLARASQSTLNAVMQTAWGILLGQRTGLGDVCFGNIVSLRQLDLPDIEAAAGCLMNVLPVRMRLDELETGLALIRRRMQELHAEAEYLHLDYAELLAWVQRSGGIVPYDTVFVFENFPLALPDRVTSFLNDNQSSSPLVMVIWPGEPFRMQCTYNAGLFDEPDMVELMRDYKRALLGLASDPHARTVSLLEDPHVSRPSRCSGLTSFAV